MSIEAKPAIPEVPKKFTTVIIPPEDPHQVMKRDRIDDTHIIAKGYKNIDRQGRTRGPIPTTEGDS